MTCPRGHLVTLILLLAAALLGTAAVAQRRDAFVRSRDHEAIIEVHNTGSTLHAEERDRVFDRFYRVDPARQRATGGSGLGLAIAKHLAEAQGGRVWVESDAGSVTFGVALPRV